MGLRIAFVLAIAAVVFIIASDQAILLLSLPAKMFESLEKYGLMAIPLFMLVGELMNESGITRRLMNMARSWVAPFRGGLAFVNLFANAMMATIVGSAMAQVAIMSKVSIPEMTKDGYSPEFSAATTMAGSLLSPILPPSMIFIIYGVIAEISIGDLFVAGIIPGILLTLGFSLVIFFSRAKHTAHKNVLRESLKSLKEGLPCLIIPFAIIGTIVSGVASPKEAATIAIAMILILGTVFKDLDKKALPKAILRSALQSGLILFLICTAQILGWALVFEKLPQQGIEILGNLTENKFVFLVLLNIVLLFLGAVMEPLAALVVVVPLVLPLALGKFEIEAHHLGVLICLNLVLGLFTPPVGPGLMLASRSANSTMGNVFWAFRFYFATAIAILALLIFYSQSNCILKELNSS